MEPQPRTCAAADGTDLPMWVWRAGPGNAPTVLYLHGIQSHSGWYEASSRHLAERGIAVVQVERRGSGRDAAHPRGHVDKAATWLDDVARAAEAACAATGAAAVHLLGVSWGGKLALACVGHRPDLYRSLILSAPGIVPKVDVTLTTKVRVGQCLMSGRAMERFPIPLEDPHLFTENPARVRYIAEDPLSLRDLTARFLRESRRLDGLAREAARTVRLPTLLCLAEHDRIIDNEATRRLVYSMTARRRVRLYEGAHHTLEFEPHPTAYFDDLVAWIHEVEREAASPARRQPAPFSRDPKGSASGE
ncbi:MAG: alpha/beta fold hydrolase [Planctomycetes bacterium]|nr:alpha/beta fold hydrolase [Planctomycetota bacterium]